MNKKLLAAAIAAAMAAPMAAHASTTVYGIANANIESTDSGAATNGTSTYANSTNSSRIGVKGSEDLGGGLKAVYGMEWGVAITDGKAGLSKRNREVGLAGNFGTVELGYQDNPVKLLWTHYDFNITHVGDLGNLLGVYNRYSGIQYTSPKIGGSWTIMAAYQPENGTPDTSGTSIGVFGMIGPVNLGIGTETDKMGTGSPDQKTTRVSANMKFGMLAVNAMYSKTTDLGGNAGTDLTVNALQGKFGLGSGNDIRLSLATAKNTAGTDNKATMTTVGFDHNFSKNTAVYVDYATTDNKSGGTFTVAGGAHQGSAPTTALGQKAKSISLGVIVKF